MPLCSFRTATFLLITTSLAAGCSTDTTVAGGNAGLSTTSEADTTRALNLQQEEWVAAENAANPQRLDRPRPRPAARVTALEEPAVPTPKPDAVGDEGDALAEAAGYDPAAINPETGKTYGQEHWVVTRAAARARHRVSRAFVTQDPISTEERAGALELDEVGMPESTLSTAKVDDAEGFSVGPVYRVVLDEEGEPETIEVEISGGYGWGEELVVLDAGSFVYLPVRNILVADLTREEIVSLSDETRQARLGD